MTQLRKKQKVITNERDMAIFTFLWRWKLSTTKAIAEKYFPNTKSIVAYNRLLQLRNAGYLRLRSLDPEGSKFVWTLSEKGFDMLANRLPSLQDVGFKSECLEHDHLVMAVHLGEWLIKEPDGIKFFTEQELRRFPLDRYPSWVPKTDFHRPDGYWHMPYKNHMITIALEVELTLKFSKEYRPLADFYERNPDIFRIIWIVRSQGTAKSMQELFKNVVKRDGELIHNFVVRKDFERMGWQAPVILGYEQGRTLAFALGINEPSPMQRPMHSPMQSPCSRMLTALLNTRKRPGDSNSCPAPSKTNFADRMAYRPSANPITINTDDNQSNQYHTTVHIHIGQPSNPDQPNTERRIP